MSSPSRYPEGHVELRRSRRRLFASAIQFARYGFTSWQWSALPEIADDLEAISDRDYRAIVAYAWRAM